MSAVPQLHCDLCQKPMQLVSKVENPLGDIIGASFICMCSGSFHYQNWHAGDKTRKD